MDHEKRLVKYFYTRRLEHLPLYKLLASGLAAVMLLGGTGAALAAAALLPADAASAAASAPAPTLAPVQTATPETARKPAQATESEAVPHTPDPEVQMDATAVQQDVGVQLYLLTYPQQPVFDDPEDEDRYIPHANEKRPLTGVPATVVLTDGEGEPLEYAIDPATGTALAEDVTPGVYTVEVQPLEGYNMPAAAQVEVKEKVEYKADTAAVQEKIVQDSEVSESQEDSGYGGASVIANEVTDTVAWAEPAQEEVNDGTVYTAQLSSDGHLLMSDGAVTPYLPTYDGNGLLTGAVREGSSAAAGQAAAVGQDADVRYLGKDVPLNALRFAGADIPAWQDDPTPSPAPTPSETPLPSEAPSPAPDATIAPETTAVPDVTSAPAETSSPDGGGEPTATPDPAAIPEFDAGPTAAPSGQQQTPENDPTAGFPDAIPAAELAGYGFAVTTSQQATYRYTGWQTINGKTYYYDPATGQPVTGTQVIQGNIYQFAADGALGQTARGVDVSKFQGNIDWNAVAADGITFAIIRCGYRGYGSGALVEDSTFRANIAGATAAGLQVGVYFYGQAINEAEAVEEASMVLSLCSGYSLPVGVYYDTEKVAGDTGRADGISAAERTACAVAFCETVRSAGYTAGVYSYANWFYTALNFANISKYRIWIAQYRDTLDFGYGYNIWQYSSTGTVSGIPKPVDMNLG